MHFVVLLENKTNGDNFGTSYFVVFFKNCPKEMTIAQSFCGCKTYISGFKDRIPYDVMFWIWYNVTVASYDDTLLSLLLREHTIPLGTSQVRFLTKKKKVK